MKRLTLFVSFFGLTGCIFGNIEKGLTALQGQHIRTAFKVLGYPDGQQQFGGDTVYFWNNRVSGTHIMPQTAYTSGAVGATPYSGTTMYNQAVPYNYACKIRVVTGPNEIITAWDYNGNIGACSAYSGRLQNYFESQNQVKP